MLVLKLALKSKNSLHTYQLKSLLTVFLDRAGHEIVGKVHVKQIYEIAKMKQRDEHLKHLSLEAMCRTIAGSCASMGIEITRDAT